MGNVVHRPLKSSLGTLWSGRSCTASCKLKVQVPWIYFLLRSWNQNQILNFLSGYVSSTVFFMNESQLCFGLCFCATLVFSLQYCTTVKCSFSSIILSDAVVGFLIFHVYGECVNILILINIFDQGCRIKYILPGNLEPDVVVIQWCLCMLL